MTLKSATPGRPSLSPRRSSRGLRCFPRLVALEDRTLLSPGAIDPNFGVGGKASVAFDIGGGLDDEARAVVLQPDGKTVMVGAAQTGAGGYDFAIARLNSNGTPDGTFDSDGKQTVAFNIGADGKDRGFGVALQPDGKIIVVGSAQVTASGFDFAIARLNPNGSPDTSFNGTGRQVVPFDLGGIKADEATSVVLQPDGKIVIAGYAGLSATNRSFAVARLNGNGSLDTSFNGSGKMTFKFGTLADEARSLALQPDGKIIVVGYSQVVGANNDFAIARLHGNGTLDPSFNLNGKRTVAFDFGGGKNDGARSVALQPDGRIVAAGYAERIIPNYDFAVVRLNSDGNFDTTFNSSGKQVVTFDVGGGKDDEATSVVVQPNGRLLVAGFAQVGATNFDFAIARLTANGSLDPAYLGTGKQTVAFNLGGPNQDEAFGAAIQPNGYIVAVGFAQRSIENFDFVAVRIDGNNTRFFSGGGKPGYVAVFRADGSPVTGFSPFGDSYQGNVAVAFSDVNGDGFDDLIAGAQIGNPHVKVFNGAHFALGTFNPAHGDASLLASFFPYALNFNVGSNVTGGDVNGDGYADIVTAANAGNPHTKVYTGKDIAQHVFNPDGASLLAQWFPYALQFNVGANVAVGHLTGTGFADVITGATVGNPDVRVYRGRDIAANTFLPDGASRAVQFFAYGLNFNVGVLVTAGDVNGDGFSDLITGSSIGNPEVKVYSGKAIAQSASEAFVPDSHMLAAFYAYDIGVNLGAAVASADFDGDGQADILTGPLNGSIANYRVVRGLSSGIKPAALPGYDGVISQIQGGMFVGT
jgi:uncharacterized delta-60 repeat protein